MLFSLHLLTHAPCTYRAHMVRGFALQIAEVDPEKEDDDDNILVDISFGVAKSAAMAVRRHNYAVSFGTVCAR